MSTHRSIQARTGQLLALGGLAMVLGIGLAGCGNTAAGPGASASTMSTPADSSPASPTASPAVVLPDCAKVWVVGKKLAGNYQGCTSAGNPVKADRISCSSGQVMVRYLDRFYAVRGGTVTKAGKPGLNHDQEYLHRIRVCRG